MNAQHLDAWKSIRANTEVYPSDLSHFLSLLESTGAHTCLEEPDGHDRKRKLASYDLLDLPPFTCKGAAKTKCLFMDRHLTLPDTAADIFVFVRVMFRSDHYPSCSRVRMRLVTLGAGTASKGQMMFDETVHRDSQCPYGSFGCINPHSTSFR